MRPSQYDGPAVAAAHRLQSWARLVQIVAAGLAGLSLIGAVLLAAVNEDSSTCVRIMIAGGDLTCADRRHPFVGLAVVGEVGVLFALLVVVLAAKFVWFQAELVLAQAERGWSPDAGAAHPPQSG